MEKNTKLINYCNSGKDVLCLTSLNDNWFVTVYCQIFHQYCICILYECTVLLCFCVFLLYSSFSFIKSWKKKGTFGIHTYNKAGVPLCWVIWTPFSALLKARGEVEPLCILTERKKTMNHFNLSVVVRELLWNNTSSYHVSAKRSEGVCSTDIQVSLIESLQEADVIVALCLQRTEENRLFLSQQLARATESIGQSIHFMYRGYFMQKFNERLGFCILRRNVIRSNWKDYQLVCLKKQSTH